MSHARTGTPPYDHRGTSDHYHTPLTFLPQHAELRLAPVDFVDLGMDLSWLDGGLDLRVGRPAAKNRFWVGHVAAGARSGSLPEPCD